MGLAELKNTLVDRPFVVVLSDFGVEFGPFERANRIFIAIRKDNLKFIDVIFGFTVLERLFATGVIGQHTTDCRHITRSRISWHQGFVLECFDLKIPVEHTGLGLAFGRTDVLDFVKMSTEIDDNRIVDRTARYIGAGGASRQGQVRQAVFVGRHQTDQFFDVSRIFGENDEFRHYLEQGSVVTIKITRHR